MHVMLTDESSEHHGATHMCLVNPQRDTNNMQRFKHLLRFETLLNVTAYSARLFQTTIILIHGLGDTQSEVQMTLKPTAAATLSFPKERTSIQYRKTRT